MENEQKVRSQTVRSITIDLDYPYTEYIESNHFQMIQKVTSEWQDVRLREIRTSPSGRVHLRIWFDKPITVLASFCRRAVLGDDPFRLACDLARLELYGDEKIGRTFDVKYVDGQQKRAGNWRIF